jgi:two-component system CheB/CheR fusion protein
MPPEVFPGELDKEGTERIARAGLERPHFNKAARNLFEDFKEVLSEDYGYAAIYIDVYCEVKEATGDFRKYLSLPDKLLNLNLLKMVPSDVAALLGGGIRKAQKEAVKVILKRMRVNENGNIRYLDVVIKPAEKTGGQYTLIVFGESNDKSASPHAGIEVTKGGSGETALLTELEAELKETKVNLQTAIEELETTNEELQSSNEELLSANEELQSSNEELQSLNEELHTLNTEHQIKIKELIELNNDLDNYFRSNDIGQIFLDDKLRIRKFNPSAVKMINLIEADIGRPFEHISTNIKHENLLSDIQQVILNRLMIEKEVQLSNGTNCLMRVVPYLMHDRKPQGVVITFVDISAIKDLNNIIKGVFNSSLSAIMAFKAIRNVSQEIIDFKWVAANHACDKMLGKSCTSLEGKLLKTEFPALVKDGLFQKFIDVVGSNRPLHIEYFHQQESESVWYELSAVKMMDGLVVNFYDITEEKEAQERLRKNYNELMNAKDILKKLNDELEDIVSERTRELSVSDERFTLVAKATNDAIWDWKLSENEIWWSDSFYSLFGYESGSQKFDSHFRMSKIHPEDIGRVRSSIYKTINSNETQWSEEYRFMKADGSYANILDRGYLLKDEFGSPYRMLGSMLDVTNLRHAEREVELNIEERKFLAEAIPMIVWIASPTGTLDFLNQHYTYYTGESIEDGLSKGWRKIIHLRDIAALEAATKDAIITRSDFSVEIRIKRFDGEFRWHLLRARAKKDDSGRLTMWVGTSTDIHEQKLANQILEQRVADRTRELQEVVKELEMSNIDLQQFAYVASHDLKEPLRKIHMFSSMVKDKYLAGASPVATDYMERIITSSARMTKLINDLLNFSKLSVSKLLEVTDMELVIKDILSDLELSISEKRAVIHVSNIPQLEVVPAQIRQVFQNIISNAIKFSRPDVKPEVTIHAEGYQR